MFINNENSTKIENNLANEMVLDLDLIEDTYNNDLN